MIRETANCKIGACVLAGGKARRLRGVAKGALEAAGGPSIIERLIEELDRAGVEEIIISTNDPLHYRDCGRTIVADLRRGVGPLGGIEAALAYFKGRSDAVIFLPCDVPAITAKEIGALKKDFLRAEAGVVFAESGKDFWHPLCAVVHHGSLRDISAAIDRGQRSVREVWRRLGAQPVHFENEAAFLNINTPEDLELWRSRCEGLGK